MTPTPSPCSVKTDFLELVASFLQSIARGQTIALYSSPTPRAHSQWLILTQRFLGVISALELSLHGSRESKSLPETTYLLAVFFPASLPDLQAFSEHIPSTRLVYTNQSWILPLGEPAQGSALAYHPNAPQQHPFIVTPFCLTSSYPPLPREGEKQVIKVWKI